MSKRVPNEERRVSTTFAVSQNTLRLIDTMGENMGLSRSGVVNSAIGFYYRWFLVYGPNRSDWIDEDPHEISSDALPDDEVCEVGYNPYTRSLEDDL